MLCVKLVLLAALSAQQPAGIRESIIFARDLSYRQLYQTAREKVELLKQQPDTRLPGLFWQACLLQLLIYDSGNTALVDSFEHCTEQVLDACRRRLQEHEQDASAHLYLGLALLNRANLLSWQNRKFDAFRTMLRVPSHLKRALTLDPQLHDARFGLAVIEYFKATADRYCLGLGLFGSRERAYRQMEEARLQAELLQPMAEFMLGFMHKEDRNYPAAIRYCQHLLRRYPGNRSARRLLRDVYLAKGDYRQAIALGRELDADIRRTFPDNRYGLTENWLKLAYAWQGLGVADSAVHYANRIIALECYASRVPWLGSYVREAKALKYRQGRG
ncbi:MAG: tetratricopeptide repeat protein [candidate division WOR-3 bacterium]